MLTRTPFSLTAASIALLFNHGVQVRGSVTMSKVIELKLEGHSAAASETAVREMASDIQQIMEENEAREIPCVDGLIAGKFHCKNMNLVSFLTGEQLGSPYASNPRPLISATWVSAGSFTFHITNVSHLQNNLADQRPLGLDRPKNRDGIWTHRNVGRCVHCGPFQSSNPHGYSLSRNDRRRGGWPRLGNEHLERRQSHRGRRLYWFVAFASSRLGSMLTELSVDRIGGFVSWNPNI